MASSRAYLLCTVTSLTLALAITVGAGAPRRSGPVQRSASFDAHLIDSALTGGYQVVIADMNRDGKPDIIAIASGLSDIRWYENPGWQKHVIASGLTEPINAAAFDVDGDGIPEIALAHDFSNIYAQSVGTVSILTHQGDPTGLWARRDIDRVPTSHRLRFADVDGSGHSVLVNAPLIGAKALAPTYRDHLPLLMYRPGAWAREVISDGDEGVVHGLLPTRWNGDNRESIITASFLGAFLHRYDNGRWSRTRLVAGDPSAWPQSGASDVAIGHIGRARFLVTIEPWHGNEVVVYRARDGAWARHVIDSTVTDGHSLVVGDFDRSGRDEIVVGERGGKRSVYRYRLVDERTDAWSRSSLDDGGMAAAGCAVADLNGDQRADVICIGTATANLKWYENRP